MKLQNKVVMITGASSGLGEQVAYAAAEQGATLVLLARRIQRLQQIKIDCEELSGEPVFIYHLDIGSGEQIATILPQICQEVGNIDILVNSAGFGLFREALDMPMELTKDMFKVNVLGLIEITKIVAKRMKNQRGGQIINIASQASKMATSKSSVYAATKFAVRGYSNALRLELHPFGINVLTVNTGPMRTDFSLVADETGEYLNSLGRWVLEPEQVATQVVRYMLTTKREINLPIMMEVGARLYDLFPTVGDYLARTKFARK